MRGLERIRVAVALAVAMVGAGALVGAAAGIVVVVIGVEVTSSSLRWVAAALVAVALTADAAWRRGSAPHPLATWRQVPREWGSLFEPVTVAVLYGTRLGIGPSTQLSTWLWWAATLIAALSGVVAAAVIGVVFAGVRWATIVAYSLVADRPLVDGVPGGATAVLVAAEPKVNAAITVVAVSAAVLTMVG